MQLQCVVVGAVLHSFFRLIHLSETVELNATCSVLQLSLVCARFGLMWTYAAARPRPIVEPVGPYTRAVASARPLSQFPLQGSRLLPQSRGKERPEWDARPVASPVLVLRRGGSLRHVLVIQAVAAEQAAAVLLECSAICVQDMSCVVAKAPGEFVVDPSSRA